MSNDRVATLEAEVTILKAVLMQIVRTVPEATEAARVALRACASGGIGGEQYEVGGLALKYIDRLPREIDEE